MTKQIVTITRIESVTLELDVPQRLTPSTIETWANEQVHRLGEPEAGKELAHVRTDWKVVPLAPLAPVKKSRR